MGPPESIISVRSPAPFRPTGLGGLPDPVCPYYHKTWERATVFRAIRQNPHGQTGRSPGNPWNIPCPSARKKRHFHPASKTIVRHRDFTTVQKQVQKCKDPYISAAISERKFVSLQHPVLIYIAARIHFPNGSLQHNPQEIPFLSTLRTYASCLSPLSETLTNSHSPLETG